MNFTYEELTARLNGLKYELKCVEMLTRLPKEIKHITNLKSAPLRTN